MNRPDTLRRVLRGMTLLGAVAVAGVIVWRLAGGGAEKPSQNAIFLPPEQAMALPDFTLTERSGRAVSRSELDGKVWVANFIFTRCTGPCPVLSKRMSRLHKELSRSEGVRFVSFSVDPAFDSPQVLSRYAKKYQASEDRWLFLTGRTDDIHKLLLEHFRVAIQDVAEGGDPGTMTHGLSFVLVDDQSRIRGYPAGGRRSALRRLREDIRRLEQERA